jgi:hypothetical protein
MAGSASDMSAPDMEQAQKTALALFHTGDFGASNGLLLRICQGNGGNAFRRFCIGRNFRHLGDLSAAREWLALALRNSLQFPWLYYEMALLELQCGAVAAAGEMMRRCFGTAGQSKFVMNNVQKRAALLVCHREYERDRSSGLRLYRLADAQGLDDSMVGFRLVDDLLDDGDIEPAATRMAELRTRHKLGPAGHLTLGRILRLTGHPAEAADAVASWRMSLRWLQDAPVASFPRAVR